MKVSNSFILVWRTLNSGKVEVKVSGLSRGAIQFRNKIGINPQRAEVLQRKISMEIRKGG